MQKGKSVVFNQVSFSFIFSLKKISHLFHNIPIFEFFCCLLGVVRSNCIDSLDRTNAAQYVTGKGNQLT